MAPTAWNAGLRACGLLQLWPDLPRAEPPRGAKSLTRATLDVDHPDLVVVLLGVNDLGAEPTGMKIVERTSARLERIQQEASSPGRTVLLATLLPNRRDPRLKLSAVIITLHVLGQTLLGFKVTIAQILVTMVVCGAAFLVLHAHNKSALGGHLVLAIEAVEILLFALFWAVQTNERWNQTV